MQSTAYKKEFSEEVITGEDLASMGDIGPCELVKGKVAQMSPTGEKHGAIESNLVIRLGSFVKKRGLGCIRSGEVGIYTHRNPDTVRGVDVLYISKERYEKVRSASFLDVAPELVIEILSPDDRWANIMEKLHEYFESGVLVVWIVDAKARHAYAYRSVTDVKKFLLDDDLIAEDILPGFSMKVADLFEV